MKKLKPHLTYANVVATLALVLAVTGGTAAIAISTKLKKNSVTTKAIKNGAVTAPKLAAIHVVTSAPSALEHSATCPTGERLIGGGAKGTPVLPASGAPSLLSSYPDGNNWVAAPGNSANVVAYALCLSTNGGP